MKGLEIGRIGRPHGVRGEMRVTLHWDGSDALDHVREVTLERDGRVLGTFELAGARRVDRGVLVRLAGVADRDQVERLRGASVVVDRARLPPLGEGEYYLADLVGARVVGPSGIVGEVVEVRMHPSVDALVVRTPEGVLLEQALSPPWLLRVDVGERLVELASTEGLI